MIVALCLRAGAVAGIRPYVKAKDWDGGRLAELLAFGGIGLESPIRSLAAYFSQWRDEGAGGLLFAGAAPCVAFDFPVSDGIVGLRPTRTKIDVPFRGLPGYPHGESSDVRARIAQLYAEVGLCAQGAIGFLDDLDHRFGGSRVEYLSAGSGQRGPEMTLYAVTAGLASQYRL
ncbi:MAG TPA: hypothetical protein VNG31_06055 [Candidatus Baltobacteraceae bacterium]|nr:hypothetical protein [Candidatus Baltobacteraceae bacterium]